MTAPTNAEVLAGLNRIKVLFQARAVALALGAAPPVSFPPESTTREGRP